MPCPHSGKIDAVSRALKVAEETIDGVDDRQRVVKDQINAYVDEVRACVGNGGWPRLASCVPI